MILLGLNLPIPEIITVLHALTIILLIRIIRKMH